MASSTFATLLLSLAAAASLVAACDSEVRDFGETSSGSGGAATATGTTSGGGQGGVAGVCAPGETRCAGDAQETCDASGQWGPPAPCRIGCSGVACVLVTGMSLGDAHTCATLSDGTARCWGSSEYGQLGDGTSGSGAFRTTPGPVPGLTAVTQIAAGNLHTCAALSDGSARCWGHNGFGKLGDGSFTQSAVPKDVVGIANVAGLSLGHSHSCAWLSDGTAKCWGINQFGQLGNGGTTDSATPVTVVGLSNAVSLSAGDRHNCALLADGTARCWGDGYSGQLGDGSFGAGSQKLTPSPVPNYANVTQIEVGFYSSCGVQAGGALSCWGANLYGQVGDGTTADNPNVTLVDGLAGVALIAPGFLHVCAVRDDGNVFCWGRGSSGELGTGAMPISQTTPQPVLNLSGVAGVAGGGQHTCAWLPDATVYCWGNNDYGQLGDGTSGGNKSLPVEVTW